MSARTRSIMIAALTIAAAALTTSTATAAISPDPYATSAGTGTSSTSSALGTSTCSLSGVVSNATGTADGATGRITGFTGSGCSGTVSSLNDNNKTWDYIIVRGTVIVNAAKLYVNFIGGNCLYTGTLTGTMAHGGNAITVSGTLRLYRHLAGLYCSGTKSLTLTVVLPGASVTW